MEDFYGFLNKSKSSYIFSPKFLTRPDFYIKHQVLIFKNNGIDCVKLIKHEMSNSKYFLYKGTVKTILDNFLFEKKTSSISQKVFYHDLDNVLINTSNIFSYDNQNKMFSIGCQNIKLHVFEGACVALGLLKYER
mgnify:CR=1 FL=1